MLENWTIVFTAQKIVFVPVAFIGIS